LLIAVCYHRAEATVLMRSLRVSRPENLESGTFLDFKLTHYPFGGY